jgi:hypothetical protein
MGLAGSGIQTAAIAMGGGPPSAANIATELYDGTSWTNSTNTSVPHQQCAGGTASPNSSSLIFGGSGNQAGTEEFTGAFNATQTLTTST